MAIEKDLLDQLLAGRDPNQVFAKDGLLDDLKKALSERILSAELDEHLQDETNEGIANRRNGHSKKTVVTGTSKMTLSIPRDRAGSWLIAWQHPTIAQRVEFLQKMRDQPTLIPRFQRSIMLLQGAFFVLLGFLIWHFELPEIWKLLAEF